ncbi:hypothetical protein [Serratia liquefaciens]|jgi:hypothetical protein|nr:hypothetical protein [Serratia liquefaciens]
MKSEDQRRADARDRKRAQRQREREAASSAAVSGEQRRCKRPSPDYVRG